MKEKAIEKINNELKEEMSGKVGAIAPAVAEQLKSFCSQSPEFARGGACAYIANGRSIGR